MNKCDAYCNVANEFCFCNFELLVQAISNDNHRLEATTNNGDIFMPPDELLEKPSALSRMALILKNLMPTSRRKRPAQFQDILIDFNGDCFKEDSIYFDHKELDAWVILGFEWVNENPYLDNKPRDSSGQWISSFLKCIEKPRKIRSPKNIEKYRLIYLVIAIKYPDLAVHIFN